MEQVEFLTVESGDDLIVSFAIRSGPGEIRSLTLMRTPKYEFILEESERGVNVSDDEREEDDGNLLRKIDFGREEVRIVCQNSDYRLDCSRVDTTEIEDAKKILQSMNFDGGFRFEINGILQ